MPTYQYRCKKCSHEFEEFQSINAEPVSICPECGGIPERVITGGAGFLFKGSGFYITDNRSKSYKSDQAKDTGSSGSDSKKTETKKPDKPSSPKSDGKKAS
jgi:putative FmdB family regulatory protein